MSPERSGLRPGASEAELIERAKAGDEEAFARLAASHADRLFAVLVRLLGNPAEAEDVAQEVLLRAWRGIGRFEGRSKFFTWVYRIALNEANRSLERRGRRLGDVPVDDDALQIRASPREEPSARVEQHELRETIDRALGDLSLEHRTAIVLRDVEGLSTRESAEIVGVKEAAFKSRLHQARLRVRAQLGDEVLIAVGC